MVPEGKKRNRCRTITVWTVDTRTASSKDRRGSLIVKAEERRETSRTLYPLPFFFIDRTSTHTHTNLLHVLLLVCLFLLLFHLSAGIGE